VGLYIKNFEGLARTAIHRDVLEVLEQGLRAADPEEAIPGKVRLEGRALEAAGTRVELGRRIIVAGFGKASYKMLKAVYKILGDKIEQGAVIIPREYQAPERLGRVEVLRGEHPLPGRETLRSSERLLEILESVGEGDTVMLLISGGGSSLFEAPVEGVGIEDIAETTKALLRAGATIEELNAVRKHISRVKGGRLGKALKKRGAEVVALIASDVVGDPIEVIASGPTAPDSSTYCEALSILRKKLAGRGAPENIVKTLEKGCRGELGETPKPGDKDLESIANIVIISNTDSLKAMKRASIEKGYRAIIVTNMLEGEAREVGKIMTSIALSIKALGEPLEPPAMALASGETTVEVRGRGIGGRNHELALSAALKLSKCIGCIVASIGSDGVDGVSPAAGGIADWLVRGEAEALGIDLEAHLEDNDSYTALSKLGRSIYTGYTGVNVGDLIVIAVGTQI